MNNSATSENKEKETIRTMNYAAATQNCLPPKRDQGLILDCVDGLNLTDYTCAIGEIIQPKNILYASRISNNRVCLYLTSKALVDSITENKSIQIGEAETTIRPLVSKQKRVVFSNVAPPIPNYLLEDALEKLDIKRTSSIFTLKANISKEGYEHILSSRRQAFIEPEDEIKLPELLKITYEDVTYFIYPTTDVLKCFTCKMEGHIAKNCPTSKKHQETIDNTSNSSNNTTSENSTAPNISPLIDNSVSAITTDSNSSKFQEVNKHRPTVGNESLNTSNISCMPPPTKRAHSSSNSSCSYNLQEEKINTMKTYETRTKKSNKRLKTISREDVSKQIEPIRILFTDSKNKYPLNFESTCEFLFISYNNSNILEDAAKFTTDIEGLLTMLTDIHDNSEIRNLKSRINRIIKRLKNNPAIASQEMNDLSDDTSSIDDSDANS